MLDAEPSPTVYVQLHTAPKDCALDDREAWQAANPALGAFLNEEQFADAKPFVKENTNVVIRFFKGAPFSVAAPNFVSLEVTHTEPGFKGDTASNTTKPATVETGYTLNVPLFVNTGDMLRIDTRTGEYMERV